MSKYFNAALSGLQPYAPGEQPKVKNLIKLNTNESPVSERRFPRRGRGTFRWKKAFGAY